MTYRFKFIKKYLEADKILKNWRRHIIFLALICALMLIFSGSASATDLNTTSLSDYSNIYVNVSNDEGVSFNTTGNGTYYIQRLSAPNGGFNAVHIANDSSYTLNYGGSTNTTNQSGTFYATDTGGRGYQDDGVLLVAVNGTIPDNFALHLTVSGYYWTPTGDMNAAPALSAIYYGTTLDETFTKSDFLYGPQNWKPTGGNSNYPIFLGEDMNSTDNMFYLMFIDLHAGLIGSNYKGVTEGNSYFINNGAIEINYSFENLISFAAFNIYAWNWNTTQGQGMLWTNSILPGNTGGPSGYTVTGTPKPSAAFTANPTSDTTPLNIQFTDKSTGVTPLTYAWDFDNDGKIDSTEQNPVWTYSSSDTYHVTLTVTNAYGSDQITKDIIVDAIPILTSIHGGLYNTSLAVNLTSPADTNAKIYYTLNGSTPTTSSACYNGPINITSEGATTLKFIAVDGDLISQMHTEDYTLDLTIPTVAVNPAGSTYNTAQNVTLTTADNRNTTTYYTTDGSDPKSSNTRTVYSKPIQIHANTTLNYVAVDTAGNWSPVYTENYNMVDIAAPIASADLPSGNYTTDQDVDLSAVDEMDPDPQIYYTLNGTDPTVNSTPYYLSIPIDTIGTTVLKFIAVDNAGHISDIITRVYGLDKASVSGTWNSTLVDTNNLEYNSIVIDSAGYPHIAYYQNAISGGNPQLKYAYKDKNGWHIETVESSGSGSGAHVSLALDSAGNPHLAYEDIFGGAVPYMLKYAYRDSTGWHISTLTTSYEGNTRGDQIEGINLVLYNDQPRISFYNDTGRQIEYMYRNNTSWVTEIVATSGSQFDSLVLDSSGNPQISYCSISPQSGYSSLRYAQRMADGTWKRSIVDNSAYYVGEWNSLALDSFGNPYISYIWNNKYLRYAYWNGTQWQIANVSDAKSSAIKMVLDQSNSPLIVFQDATNQNLEYAYREGGNWIISNIDSFYGTLGQFSLTLNSSGVPNVSYESIDSNLRYAYLIPFNLNASLSGGTYNTSKMVTLTATPGTTIYYTTNGTTDPRTSDNKVEYTGPILINRTITLIFAAEDSADNWSQICTEKYTIIDNITPTASASIPGGLYNTAKRVTLSMSEIGSIYYTTNGYTPTTSSTKYTGPISITSTHTLKFLAVDGVGNKSPVYTVKYVIDKSAPKVSSTYPKNKATGVSRTKTMYIKFSESIKSSVNWSKVYVKNLRTGKKVSISKWISGNILYIKTGKRSAYTWYQVYIPSYAIKDRAGNNLASRYSFTFKTGRY